MDIESLKKTYANANAKIVSFLAKYGVNTLPKMWWVFTLLVALFGYGYYVKRIYKYITENYDVYLLKVYNAFGHTWLNILFFIGIIVTAIWAGTSIRKDKLFSWKRLFVEVFVLETLFYNNQWRFAEIAFGFNYKWLLILLCSALILLELVKYRFHKAPCPTPDKDFRRYITDDDFNPEEDFQRRKTLAVEIVNRALNTDLSKESFSIGITGSWGTGKSTMLSNIKEAIGNRAYIVEFNPWNSQTPSQIITDFFSEIRNVLSEEYHTLSKPLMRYANMLADIPLNPVEKWFVSKFSDYANEDISGSKEQLGKELLKVDRPVVVLIDDTDRLDADEMFEVLRLVRNTALLPNVIYFVAFDKTYLVGQLNQKKLTDAEQYAEKIFQLEVAMPYAEKHLLISALYYDINQMMKTTRHSSWLYSNISYANMTMAVEIMGSYRQVKRFARLYVTELHYMKSVFKKAELSVTDLFWLTLIQLTDHATYEQLFRNPDEYLKTEREGNFSIYLKKEGAKIENKNTLKILERLFSKNNGNINNGIRYCDNYYNYFYMGMENGRITIQEVEDLMNAGDEIDAKVEDICGKKTSQSIYHRLSGYTPRQELEQIKAYFTVLTAWMNHQTHHLMGYLFKERLSIHLVTEANRGAIRTWFVQRMKTVIDSTDNFLQIAEVLNRLYPVYPCDMDEGEVTMTHVIESGDIKQLSQHLFSRFLEKYPNQDAANILDKGKYIGKLYRELSLAVDYYSSEDISHFENMVIDVVIEYFSQHKSNQYEECRRHYMLTEEDQNSGYADDIAQNNAEDKEFLFGSSNTKFDEYIDKCFIHK